MENGRIILHCDLNNFFASVECKNQPQYASLPVAVCGNTEERHGIVLAKNQHAKKMGVITGEAVWQAKAKCSDLVILPPHYDEYVKYSNHVRGIYYRYTDMVESMGIDECWLDVTGSTNLFGSGYDMALTIKESIKKELGITASVGVSFNKIFAKLGSDLKKPDAITCIDEEHFKEQIWPLPACEMMGIGMKTYQNLYKKRIRTIGDVANCPPEILEGWYGKYGLVMWAYANGLDKSPVLMYNSPTPPKSIGHGMTTTQDLVNCEEVQDVIIELSQIIGEKLRGSGTAALGIAISVRDCKLAIREYQIKLPYATQSTRIISEEAYKLFVQKHCWENDIRSIAVRAINLVPEKVPEQLNMFSDYERHDKLEKLERAVDSIRQKYGCHAINSATYLKNIKIAKYKSLSDMPISMFQ